MERLNNDAVILNNYKIIFELEKLHKTGSLYIKRGDVLRILYFNKGNFAYAHSNQNGEKLLDVIFASGILSEDFINDVISNIKPGESLGKIFVQKGYLTPMQLSNILEKQQKKIFFSALFMKEGEIRFFDEELPENITPLNLNVIELIREGLYNSDDRLLILSLVGNFNNKLKIKNIENEYIKREEKNILDIMGEGVISEIINRSPYEEFKTLKIISFLKLIEVMEELSEENNKEEKMDTEDEIFIDTSAPLGNNIGKYGEQTKNFEFSITEDNTEEEKKKEEEYMLEDTTEKDLKLFEKTEEEKQNKTKEYIEKELSEIVKNEKRKSKKILFILFLLLIIFGSLTVYFLYFNKKENIKKNPEPITEDIKQKKVIPIEEIQKGKKTEENNKTKESLKNKIKKDTLIAEKKHNNKTKRLKKEFVPENEKIAPNIKKTTSIIIISNYLNDIRAKRFRIAALKYKRDLIVYKKYYSILIEVDCQTESLETAYQHASFSPKMFIIPRTINNRFCYAILWGLFKDKSAAEREKKNIPVFFKKQFPPPVVIMIDKYF